MFIFHSTTYGAWCFNNTHKAHKQCSFLGDEFPESYREILYRIIAAGISNNIYYY